MRKAIVVMVFSFVLLFPYENNLYFFSRLYFSTNSSYTNKTDILNYSSTKQTNALYSLEKNMYAFAREVDRRPPKVSFTAGFEKDIVTNEAFSFEFLTDEKSAYYSFDGISFSVCESNKTISVAFNSPHFIYYTKDILGNTSFTNTNRYSWDISAPIVSVVAGPIFDAMTNSSFEIILETSEADAYWSTNAQIFTAFVGRSTITILEDTPFFMYYSRDFLGNTSPTNSNTFYWDYTIPSIFVDPSEDLSTNKAFTAYLYVDEDYGYFSTNGTNSEDFNYFTFEGTNLLISESTSLHYFARDEYGNITKTNKVSYYFEPKVPSFALHYRALTPLGFIDITNYTGTENLSVEWLGVYDSESIEFALLTESEIETPLSSDVRWQRIGSRNTYTLEDSSNRIHLVRAWFKTKEDEVLYATRSYPIELDTIAPPPVTSLTADAEAEGFTLRWEKVEEVAFVYVMKSPFLSFDISQGDEVAVVRTNNYYIDDDVSIGYNYFAFAFDNAYNYSEATSASIKNYVLDMARFRTETESGVIRPFNTVCEGGRSDMYFSLTEDSAISIIIYDSMRNAVKKLKDDEYTTEGHHHIWWDLTDKYGVRVGRGWYYVELISSKWNYTTKVFVLN